MNKANLLPLSTANQLIAKFIIILIVSYHPPTRCFRIYSDWTKFHLELVTLMDVFKSSGYLENFINMFETDLDNKHRIKENWY